MRPGSTTPENVSRIQDVNFFSINSSAYDDLSSISEGLASPSFLDGSDVMRDPYSASGIQGTIPGSMYEHPCAPLIKILSSGTFYYATRPQWDLSTRLGLRFHRTGSGMDGYDDRFVWNEYIVKSLLEFRERLDPLEAAELDLCQFIVRRAPSRRFNLTWDISIDSCDSRLCWGLQYATSRSPYEWPCHWDDCADI
jgi:synaptojanin